MDKQNKPHITWRISLAKQIAGRIVQIEGVQAIIVAGSVSRGCADRFSDLEMPIFWKQKPSDAVRRAIVHELGASYLYSFIPGATEDNLLIKDFQVDLWHNVVSKEEEIIQAVLAGQDTSLSSSNFMDTLRSCIPLYGHSLIAAWKESARDYPTLLTQKVLEGALEEITPIHLMIHAARGNPTLVYEGIVALQQAVFRILLALNREYFPTYKWMYTVLEMLPLQPPHTAARFRETFQRPLLPAVQGMLDLTAEVLDLVDLTFPQANTTAARWRMAGTRRPHETPIELETLSFDFRGFDIP